MFRGLAQLFDDIAIKTILRSLSTAVAIEYETSGCASKEAEKLAWQEMYIAMRAKNLDMNSYHDVRAWKKFLHDRTCEGRAGLISIFRNNWRKYECRTSDVSSL